MMDAFATVTRTIAVHSELVHAAHLRACLSEGSSRRWIGHPVYGTEEIAKVLKLILIGGDDGTISSAVDHFARGVPALRITVQHEHSGKPVELRFQDRVGIGM